MSESELCSSSVGLQYNAESHNMRNYDTGANHNGYSSNDHNASDQNSFPGDDEVILCVFYRKNKLAAAAYFLETCELHLLYDISDLGPDYKLLRTLFIQLKPSKVVTCSSLSDYFLRTVHSLVTGEEISAFPTVDPPTFSDRLHFIPTKEFRYSTCKRTIEELKLPGEPENSTDSERYNYIKSVVDLNAPGLVSAMGGILYFLQRSHARLTLTSLESPVLCIQLLSLKDLVWIDEGTLNALQIFAPIPHPSSYKWFPKGNKEGLSVFSLLNRCYSISGSKFMRVMLSQPTRNINVLNTRHEVISFCIKPINEQVVKSMTDSIIHIKSVTKMLTKMTNAQASVTQWKAFYDTIYNAVLVGEVCKLYSRDVQFFQKIADSLCDSVFIMSHCIIRTMDFEASANINRVVIKFGISDELDEVKVKHSNLNVMMAQVAEQELLQLPDFVESCSIVYIPEVGYLLALPYWDENLTEDQLKSVPNLEYKFKTKDVIHYKSARCLEMDNLWGDVQLSVIEIESKIIMKLVQYIQGNIAPLVHLTSLIAELDCLIALAHTARDYNLVQPNLTTEKQIHITKGRHILQELSVNMFVPNDTHSDEKNGFVKVLSGPNASGKSIYLKQVALIALLAHVGSFVPAECATIGILDQIHTRIQTVESVSTHLSAFMIDLQQMSTSICNSTNNSLVVIDEFGKGTSEVDGLGILVACLEHFIGKGKECPHLFLSTHFHSLPKMLPPTQIVKFQHLEHMVDKGELVYLYRLKDGDIQSSFALQVAQAQGFSRSAAERTNQILIGLREVNEFTVDNKNRLTQVMTKRREFINKFSKTKLTDEILLDMKKEVLNLKI